MSESVRVCQFYLRGRCNREKCEFRHPVELGTSKKVINSQSKGRSRSRERRLRTDDSDDNIDGSDDSDCDIRHLSVKVLQTSVQF